MSLLREQIDRQHQEVSDYLFGKSGLSIVLLDSTLNIQECNGPFLTLLGLAQVPEQRPLADFLDLDGTVPPFPDELTLHFSRSSGLNGFLRCHFIAAADRWLLLCERPVLSESQIVQRMAQLNSELLVIQRALAQKNLLLDQVNAELKASRQKLLRQHRELRRAFSMQRRETSARLQALEASRTSEQMLIQQNRMAAVGEMLSHVAHHWRQPLNLIGLSIQELKFASRRGGLDQQLLDQGVEGAMQVLNQLSRSIDALMEISSPSHPKSLFRVDLAVARVAALVRNSMQRHGIALELHCHEEVVTHGYRNEYAQVLLTILSNARDALVDHATTAPKITLTCRSESGRSVVTIADNAGGISTEAMDRIFDAFFTTKSTGQGTGINLFVSKLVVEKKMGGSLTVRNALGGAEFRIEV